MLVQRTLAVSMPFFSASVLNMRIAAPPAGEPRFLPSRSFSVLIGLPALVISANGVRL